MRITTPTNASLNINLNNHNIILSQIAVALLIGLLIFDSARFFFPKALRLKKRVENAKYALFIEALFLLYFLIYKLF